MSDRFFLDVDAVTHIHRREIERAGGDALIFLYLNGYEVNERHPEELADVILTMLCESHQIDRESLGTRFRERAVPRTASSKV